MPDPRSRSKVTIEDLLKLKQTERPAADFWVKFEQELRQKQLAALMEKRAWWHDLPRLFTQRVYVPVGAAAVLALTFVTVQRSNAPALPIDVQSAAPSSTAASFAVAEAKVVVAAQLVSSPSVNRKEHAALAVDDRVAVASTHTVARESTAETAVAQSSVGVAPVSPSARSIAANLAQLEQAEPELVQAVSGGRLSSEPREAVKVAPAVEFASLSEVGSKRSRLLAQYSDRQVSPNPSAPEVVRERLSRRLNELDSGDRFTRVGLKADQVSLRF